MAGLDSYSSCPCGSGQKFKWCCQKVEPYVDRAQRLYETGQTAAAIKAIDEGLRKEPTNPWLLTRKAVMTLRLGEPDAAKGLLRQVLAKNPKHFGALILLTRCILETEGAVNGAGMFQEVLASVDAEVRPNLAPLAQGLGAMLFHAGRIPSALKHLALASELAGTEIVETSEYRNVEANPAISPWLKDARRLAPTPAHWSGDGRDRFEKGLQLASMSLWAQAAAAFDAVSGGEPGGEADYNLGLCRLWLGDEQGAVGPLRRRVNRLGKTAEAVDLEVVCQSITPPHPEDRVEVVELVWPLRDRQGLLKALSAKADVLEDEVVEPAEGEEQEPQDTFLLLDRPKLPEQSGVGLSGPEIPRVVGRVHVLGDTVSLETFDDGRLDQLGDRFTVIAGQTIAPAHPRTKVLGDTARSTIALNVDWAMPDGLEPEQAMRINLEQRKEQITSVWVKTPAPYLGFRTPERAAKDRDAEIPLRAALMMFTLEFLPLDKNVSLDEVRAKLNLPDEPTIDPKVANLSTISFARLSSVSLDGIDDDGLVTLYRRARQVTQTATIEKTGREIIARPHLFTSGKIDALPVYFDLAGLAASRGDLKAVLAIMSEGRKAEPNLKGLVASGWDMAELRLRSQLEHPSVWVPELTVILDRYAQDPQASQSFLIPLVEMGLINVEPNPDSPGNVYFDTRPLQMLLRKFGPRVTTASGQLGVSAAKGELWTPGSAAGGPSGEKLWTPGSSPSRPAAAPQAPAQPKPGPSRLILPGR